MKIKATKFLKHVWMTTGEVLKSKTGAVKSKAGALRTRLIVISLLRNKKFLFSTISHKIHALFGHGKTEAGHIGTISHKIHALFGYGKTEAGHIGTISHKIHALLGYRKAEAGDSSKAIVVYNPILAEMKLEQYCCDELEDEEVEEEEDENDDYPDLTHCLFDSEDLELDNQNLSVVDIVKQSMDSENFVLEDEIDRVADLFIKRFHRQMLMQKQQSFKRYQEMLNRSA